MTAGTAKFRLDSHMLKICLILLLVLCIVALFTLNFFIRAEQSRLEAARAQAAALEQSNDDYQNRIDNLGTPEGVEQIAGDELGLGKPGSAQITVK
jgi:cell division protein FtsL